MTVLARDAVASDHLVYAWPFPIGPECEIACAADEEVVMCPAWMVGDRLGPGRHHWRAPTPMHPTAAFFVRTTPVEAMFDMTTSFLIPTTGQPVRLRAAGSLQVRCADPGLLIAQFVGLPFDHVNDGILRSVSRSIERMLARLLTRRVVMAGSPIAVTDPGMLPGIVEELVAYNPTAGAVFGVELISMGQLVIGADDGSTAYVVLQQPTHDPWGAGSHPGMQVNNGALDHSQPVPRSSQPDIPLTETARGRPKPPTMPPIPHVEPAHAPTSASGEIRSGSIDPGAAKAAKRPSNVPPNDSAASSTTSGEILVRPKPPIPTPPPIPPHGSRPPSRSPSSPTEPPQMAAPTPVSARDDITQPGVRSPLALKVPARAGSEPTEQPRGAILGIGMSAIGSSAVAGEIPTKVPPGGRVLVPGPNGLMQSATVRQLLQGYYELEVGSSGETIWVPMSGVVPE